MQAIHRLLCAATLGLAVSGTASAATCGAGTIKGTWGFSYEGFNLTSKSYCAGVGLMTFTPNNAGPDSVKITLQRESCDGANTASGGATGHYTVARSCTGKSTDLDYGAAGTGKLDFNVVDSGKRMQFVLVVNGITLRGEALKR